MEELAGGMSVQLVGSFPSKAPGDYIIASAARTSFNNFNLAKTAEDDAKLIRRLYRDRHTSPFEMANVTFLVRAPKYVTIQMLRHRTFKFNEESQRYHEIKDGFLHPSSDPRLFIRLQAGKQNKQSSVAVAQDSELNAELLNHVRKMESALEEIETMYHQAIEMGMARECARFCLPMATYSQLVVQCDLNNLMKFLRLRMAPDAQYEIRLIAGAMMRLATSIFPVTMGVFAESVVVAESAVAAESVVATSKK